MLADNCSYMGPRIEWVNHAAYLLRAGDFELLTDPWLYGPVFQEGWDLVAETRHSLEALRAVKRMGLGGIVQLVARRS